MASPTAAWALRHPLRRPLRRPGTSREFRTGFTPIVDPIFASLGDSLTQYGNQGISLNGKVLTRDAAGIVTAAFTSHGIFGTPYLNIVNCDSDVTYEAFAQKSDLVANSFNYPTGVTGAAGNITGGALTQAVIQNRFTNVGYQTWLQSLLGGGARWAGNFGQGGDLASDMSRAVTQINATAANIVFVCAGINDINSGGASGATVISRVQTHVNSLVAAGKIVVLISITPLGSAYATSGKNTATLAANAGFAAMHNGTSIIYVDVHQDLVDTGATQFTDGRAWTWVTSDGVHWGERAAKIIAGRIYTAISSFVVVSNCLPVSSTDMPAIPGFTAIKNYGEWNAVGGGTQGTGSTGTLATQQTALSSNARTTIVNSLIDRGSAALGYWNNQVITPGGADIVTNYWMTNSGVTIGSLGLTTSDTVKFAVELSAADIIASNMSMLNLVLQTNSSGAFGLASCGDAIALASSAYRNDALASVVLMTGDLQLNASVTHLLSKLETRYTGVGAAHTLLQGRVALYKKNP